MVNLLFIEDDDLLTKPGVVRTLYDPACGTGGMLSVAEDHLRALNPKARLEVYGQELNAETYAICRSDMMLKGQDASHIAYGNSLLRGRPRRTAPSTTCSPTRRSGSSGRRSRRRSRTSTRPRGSPAGSAPGCPASTTARFLFLQHMISKMKPVEQGGSRRGDRLQRLPAVHRRRRLRRVRDPPLDHRERLARGHRRAARPALLQHRHLHLLLDRHQPQGPDAARQGPAHRRPRPVRRRCARASARSARRSPPTRSPRSPASTATSPRATGSRSSPTRPSGSSASPSSAPCGCRWEITDDTLAAVARRQEARQARTRRHRHPGRAARGAHRPCTDTDRKAVAKVVDPILKSAGLAAPPDQGRLVRTSPSTTPRPRSSPTARATPNPTPTSATRRTSPSPPARHLRGRRHRPARQHRVRRRRRALPHDRGPPLRPRRLGRPRQDQDRLRDPPHPPLLQVRPAPAPGRDRRRDQATRSRDPGTPWRGDRMTPRPLKRLATIRVSNVDKQSVDAEVPVRSATTPTSITERRSRQTKSSCPRRLPLTR